MTPKNEEVLAAFAEEEARKTQIIERYRIDARSNYVPFHRDTLDGLSHLGARDWAAVNANVRIRAAGILINAFEQFAPSIRKKRPRLFSVIVSSDAWITNLDNAHLFDVRAIRDVLQKRFKGLHFVGVIDAALYPRKPQVLSQSKGLVSWHVHLIFWDDDERKLAQALHEHNRRQSGLLYGVRPANKRRRSWKNAARRITYMCKTPAKSHSTFRKRKRTNFRTGIVEPGHDQQVAQMLRPGEHVHMRNALRDFSLDDLIVVGGTGRVLLAPLLAQINRDRDRWSVHKSPRYVRG